MTKRPTFGDWAILATLGLFWGTAFLGTKIALIDLQPFSLAASRITLAAAVLVPVALIGPGLPGIRNGISRRIWLHCLGMAVFTFVLPFALLSWGQLYVTSAFAGISMAVVPLLVLPLAHVMVPDERMTPLVSLGFGIGFAGTVVLIGIGTLSEIGSGGRIAIGQMACVMGSCSYAVGSIITRLCPPVPQLSLSAGALLLASIMACAMALYLEGVPMVPAPASLMAILYLGLFCTGLTTILLVTLIRRAGPAFLSQVNYQVPVWAMILGALLLDEAIPARFPIALALILIGLGVVQIARKRQRARSVAHATS